MEKHLIILDLDGTLLNDESAVSKTNKDVITTLSKLGHKVVLATGRPYHSTIEIYNELELNTPLITDNGGNIRIPSESNFKMVTNGISVECAHKIFNFSKDNLVSAFYSLGDDVYSYKYLDRLHKIFMGSEKAHIIHGDFNEFNHTPTGMIYLIDSKFIPDFESFLTKELQNEVSFRLWGKDSKHGIYELYKKGTTKLSAIKWVQNYFNIPNSNLLAFGDGVNDIEMIQGVEKGFAMPNGVKEIKDIAYQVIPYSNDDSGVGLFLKEYFNL